MSRLDDELKVALQRKEAPPDFTARVLARVAELPPPPVSRWEKFLALFLLLAGLPVYGQSFQKAKIRIDLDKLAARAEDVVEVTVEENTLRLAAKFLKDNDPEEAAVKALINGLKGVYVRVYEFDKEGEYSSSDVEGIRSQLHAPGWTKIVGVISRREGMKVE